MTQLFFVFILINVALIGKNDNKEQTIKWTMHSSIVLKLYGAIILILTIMFIVFVGTTEKTDQPESIDQLFK